MTETAAHDYSDYEEGARGSDEERHAWLNELSKLALDMPRLEGDVERANDALKKAQEALAKVAEQRIPELMEQLDLTVYPLRDGGKLTLKETIRASIPKAAERRAFAWLRENGQAGLIKRAITLTFGKGQDKTAEKLREELRAKGLEPEDKTAVHPSTLKSFVNERLEAGKELPEDLFSVFRQRTAQIST